MAKTVAPGSISIPRAGEFIANAVPDPFDERDLEYRPRLQPLPPRLDQRHALRVVLEQNGSSCTGHAIATVINTILARGLPSRASLPRVSPYMLYYLARRYDEYEGEADAGSSLRGALKGWFNHGVALVDDWPELEVSPEPDLDSPDFLEKCRDRPLGAFYRVNPYRLDDMQSAISELSGIAVSAVIHDGWAEPTELERENRERIRVISRRVNSNSLGGHAFAFVGYNEVGFLVQNSWGENWGKGGYATLPYEDWLDSAYDAWVARPGVPQTPFASGRRTAAVATGNALVTAPGPDLKRLAKHVINLANDGVLSTTGKFASSPMQIERVFEHMGRWHDCWLGQGLVDTRQVVLYAHGGLVSEASGLGTCEKHLNWWLNNRVYPIYFAWQSGPVESLVDHLVDSVKDRLPMGGLGFDLVEQFDRLVEKIARSSLRWLWDEMKENAEAASRPSDALPDLQWPPTPETQAAMAALPGASLTASRLANYIQTHGADKVRVHVVGHSAGSVFAGPLLQRLVDFGIAVDSLSLLAPAIRMDRFEQQILPHLESGAVSRFATFALSDQRELDDVVGVQRSFARDAIRINVYQKSLLYLVSRALEPMGSADRGEVPLLGMEKFFDRPLPLRGRETVEESITRLGGACIFSRSAAPADSRSDSTTHGGFDDDGPTLTSVVMRIRQIQDPEAFDDYTPHAALNEIENAPSPELESSSSSPRAAAAARARPVAITAETSPPGESPLTQSAEPQMARPTAPRLPNNRVVEVAVAPRSGSPVIDVLQQQGYRIVKRKKSTAARGSTRRKRKAT